ncbi:MAG: hypothetical protein ACPH63_05650 [Flavobacteriaceae bacterium]
MKQPLLLIVLLFCFSVPSHTFGNASSPSPIVSSISAEYNKIVNVIYKDGVFIIKGLTGTGNVKIYSIIGNEVAAFYNVDLYDFKRHISLELRTLYIVRIETSGETKLFKIVAR